MSKLKYTQYVYAFFVYIRVRVCVFFFLYPHHGHICTILSTSKIIRSTVTLPLDIFIVYFACIKKNGSYNILSCSPPFANVTLFYVQICYDSMLVIVQNSE